MLMKSLSKYLLEYIVPIFEMGMAKHEHKKRSLERIYKLLPLKRSLFMFSFIKKYKYYTPLLSPQILI